MYRLYCQRPEQETQPQSASPFRTEIGVRLEIIPSASISGATLLAEMAVSMHCISTQDLRAPVRAIGLDVTTDCMLRCDYCFREDKGPHDMEESVAFDSLLWLFSMSGSVRNLTVDFFGGEPLMRFDLIKKLVPFAKHRAASLGKHIHLGCTTNMIAVNEEIIDFWRKYSLGFHTSIDGIPEVQDAHRRFRDGSGTSEIVARNAKLILQYRPTVAARCTFCQDTLPSLAESVRYFSDLGYILTFLVPAENDQWSEVHVREIERQYLTIADFYIGMLRAGREFHVGWLDNAISGIIRDAERRAHCGAGRGLLHVAYDGGLWPCHRWKGMDGGSKWCLGDIYSGLDEDYRDGFLDFDISRDLEAECEYCLARPICGGQCLALNQKYAKSVFRPTELWCKNLQISYVHGLRVYDILLRERNKLFLNIFFRQGKDCVMPAVR